MTLTGLTHRATWKVSNGWINKYRKDPSNQELAVRAAIQKAYTLGQEIIVIKGNSYMNAVYHLATAGDDIAKFTGGARDVRVLVVRSTGEIFQANAA